MKRYIVNRVKQHVYAAVAISSGIAGLLVLQAAIDLEALHWWAALPLLALLGAVGTLSLAACGWYGMTADRQMRYSKHYSNPERKKPAEAGHKEKYTISSIS